MGETASSGTGACGAAVAYVLRGGDAPVTVRLDGGGLEVDVGEDLHVDLTGRAVPVFAGDVGCRDWPAPAGAGLDADRVVAQRLVERGLAVGRLAALADDERARDAVGAGGERSCACRG